jgi:hypothetical protein
MACHTLHLVNDPEDLLLRIHSITTCRSREKFMISPVDDMLSTASHHPPEDRSSGKFPFHEHLHEILICWFLSDTCRFCKINPR